MITIEKAEYVGVVPGVWVDVVVGICRTSFPNCFTFLNEVGNKVITRE